MIKNVIFFRCLATQAIVKNIAEEKTEKSTAIKYQSFVKNIFISQLETSQIFPFPEVLTEEQNDTLRLLIDPMEKFFEVIKL